VFNRSLVRIAFSAAVVLVLVAVPTALAGKGGKPGGNGGGGSNGTSTVSLVLMDGATQAEHGNRVTFDVSTTATDRPFVGLRCWQGSNFVYDGYVGFFPTYMFEPWLTLGSPYWVAGLETNCTARLFYYNKRGAQIVLTTISFPVAP
jgi:hypothetical protein